MNRFVFALALAPAVAAHPAHAAKKAPVAPAPAVAASPDKPKVHAPPKEPARQFIERLHQRLEALVKVEQPLDALHLAIGRELDAALDYTEMARQTVPQQWEGLQPAQRAEFVVLLAKMVQNTYVKRFKPGSPAQVAFTGSRPAGANGRVEVQTAITVKKTTADVTYTLLPADGRWTVVDLTVDEASQVQSYRKSFAKILDKEGWSGLIARCKKAASKKPQ
ncbi:MAG: ABC transporter substrate-binding protein [Deltaproteobacteria bacterium]|nr:ABC transporter substrate-binding protein [Deltaproteobacteria bacterium]